MADTNTSDDKPYTPIEHEPWGGKEPPLRITVRGQCGTHGDGSPTGASPAEPEAGTEQKEEEPQS